MQGGRWVADDEVLDPLVEVRDGGGAGAEDGDDLVHHVLQGRGRGVDLRDSVAVVCQGGGQEEVVSTYVR